jgi:4-diphosphocytidyl-2-C-methyl-D-erythritol kinase
MFEPFTERARAKVNLALHVLGRREDGYHDLDSIVAFADVGDSLVFSPAAEFGITVDGPFAGSLPRSEDNIICKAWTAVTGIAARRGSKLDPVSVHLTKNLPVSSGIGGGSANAAAAMRGFLRVAGIDRIDDEILAVALSLGSDVPVCLVGKASRMQGVGERITPIDKFQPRHAILVNPRIEVSTPAVFRQLGLARGQRFGAPITDQSDCSQWRNDLSRPAIGLAPVIATVLASLEKLPRVTHAFMSGSGATCVALSNAPVEIGDLDRAWWTVPTRLA